MSGIKPGTAGQGEPSVSKGGTEGISPATARSSGRAWLAAVLLVAVAAVGAWSLGTAILGSDSGGTVITILGASVTLAGLVWPDVSKSQSTGYGSQKGDIAVMKKALSVTGMVLTFAGVVVGSDNPRFPALLMIGAGILIGFLLVLALVTLNAFRERRMRPQKKSEELGG